MEFPDFPLWRQVADFLAEHVRPADRLLAPDHFLALFPGVLPPQIRRAWLDAPPDWYVLNVEALPRVDPAMIREMLAQAHPVWVNPAFFVFSRREDVPRWSMQDPAFRPLQLYVMAEGLNGPARKPPVRRGAVVTTWNRPHFLEGTLASLGATGIDLLVIDDGSPAAAAERNRALAEAAGAAYQLVPGNRGLPTTLSCGVAWFLADPRVTWISSFNDDVAVDPAIWQVLGTVEATGDYPLMSGYLSPLHKVHGTREIGGRTVSLLRSMPGQHMHASAEYWRRVLPVPTPYLGAPKPTGGLFDGQGADEDWWVASYAPRSVVKQGGFIAAVPDLVRNLGLKDSTWAPTA